MPKLLKKRGGARPGSGQKPIGASRRIIKTIALEQRLWDAIEAYRTQAGLSRNGAVHKLLSECLLIDAPSVQKPLIDKPNDNKANLPDWFTSEKPTFEELISDYTPAKFGQWLAENLPPLSPELQSNLKTPWRTADPNTLNGLRQYGTELIGAIKAGKLKVYPAQAAGMRKMDDRELRRALITLAGITL